MCELKGNIIHHCPKSAVNICFHQNITKLLTNKQSIDHANHTMKKMQKSQLKI